MRNANGSLAAFVAPAAAFVLTLAMLPPLLTVLRRRNLLDVPNQRSSHTAPTPRGAGLALAIGVGVAMAFASSPTAGRRVELVLIAACFGSIGLADDIRPMSPLVRLGLQVLAAVALFPWQLHDLGGPALWQFAFIAGCAVWRVSFVNAFNFMDGINGISVGTTVVVGTTAIVITHVRSGAAIGTAGAVVVAAAIAFLPFNFPRARFFLGDVGSYFIGAWLAELAVLGVRAGVPLEAVLAPLGVYLADTATTIIRRVRAREVWYEAHRDHTYQRLVMLGWSHTKTTFFVTATTGLCAALGLLSLAGSPIARVIGDIGVLTALLAYLIAPRVLTRQRFS